MPFIHLTNFIGAPVQRVFDLSRSVAVNKNAMKRFNETIIAGTMTGLVKLNDTVTWKAKHIFKERILKIQVTEMKEPDFFIDEQMEGDFKMLKHEHYFKNVENGTIMIDQFRYELGYGMAGKLFNKLYLQKYITHLLELRNTYIKNAAEGNQWKQLLN